VRNLGWLIASFSSDTKQILEEIAGSPLADFASIIKQSFPRNSADPVSKKLLFSKASRPSPTGVI
jgi:hypothetical protein